VRVLRALIALAIVGVTGGHVDAALAQSPQPSWGALPDPEASVELTLGEPRSGTLSTRDEEEILRVSTQAPFSLVQVRITHTDRTCEIWATLVDIDGTSLGRTFVLGSRENPLTGLAAAAGPIFVVLDDGPYARCAGAAYRLVAEVAVFPSSTFTSATGETDPGAPSASGSTAGLVASVPCGGWCDRVEQLTTKIRRTRYAMRRARRRHEP
jgi:hypothetical protein